MFSDFRLSIIFAPPIVFQNIIVCGQALEVNCISDLSVDFSIDDLELMNRLSKNILSTLSRPSATATRRETQSQLGGLHSIEPKRMNFERQTSFAKSILTADQFDSDSGFKSNRCNDRAKMNWKNDATSQIQLPQSLSFVGGIFTFQLFERKSDENSNPIFSIRLIQPNLYDCIESDHRLRQFCLYDFNLCLFNAESKIEKILDTQRGEIEESGISPPLFKLREMQSSSSLDTKIVCEFRKSLQLKLTPQNVKQLFAIKKSLERIQFCNPTSSSNVTQAAATPLNRFNKIENICEALGNVVSVDFNMIRLSVNLMTSTNSLLSISLFKCDARLRVAEHSDQISMFLNVGSIAMSTEHSMILHPASIDFDCTLAKGKWKRKRFITTNVQANVVDFQMSPVDVQTLAKVQVEFTSCLHQNEKEVDEKGDEEKESDEAKEKFESAELIPITLPSLDDRNSPNDDQYFQDDLRLGTFEYINVNADGSLPLPYQIYLSHTENEMQICWRYPNPRAINFIQVFPILRQVSFWHTLLLFIASFSYGFFTIFCSCL